MNRFDALNSEIPAETLQNFVMLGRRLAAQMAADSFQALTAASGWTVDHVEAATEVALERMEVSARDAFAAKGGDPDGGRWQAIWTAMETEYREATTDLLRMAGERRRDTLQ